MSLGKWTEVDQYITETLVHSDPALEVALRRSAESGLPPIHVSPPQGLLLMLLARAASAPAGFSRWAR